ncbi:MAG: hypothetical protein ACOX7O_11340 [Oscillospiraceae bacterium]|jgi:hypothetical protein
MKLKHRVKIRIADRKGKTQDIIESGRIRLPKKLLTFLFGEFCEVLVLAPSKTVIGIEITKCKDIGGERND